ncbi:MAG: threonylcarbamoyl-AMP synthase [Alphaproteobacteria bacterium]|nr:threonylcarbamoyl-AMP synthase [Alphaproteobacteria bacterium]
MTRIISVNDEAIKEAVQILKDGGLVAMPTETVYGLGANALDGKAVARIFEAKGRPSFNPLIAHFYSYVQAEEFAVFNEQAKIIAHHLWPGPLTLILPRKKDTGLSELATAGLETLAVRVPNHPVALALLKEVGVPIVAPSANRSGSLSPTSPAHVADSLGDKVDIILAAGSCSVGLESTVLDLSGEQPCILRPGAIIAEDIQRVLGVPVSYDYGESSTPKSPGMLLKHYAPDTPVRLNATDLGVGEALLAFGLCKFIGVESGGFASDLPDTMLRNLSEEGDLHAAASNLFAMLKDLDQPEHKSIAVMSVPETGLGVAINDRLRRAASQG